MNLKQARTAILPAAALAAAGVTVWLDILGGTDVDRDDLCPAVLTIILGVWAMLNYYTRKFWRDSRKAKFENAVAAMGVGVRAATETILGDGQHDGDGPSSPRRLSAGPAGPR